MLLKNGDDLMIDCPEPTKGLLAWETYLSSLEQLEVDEKEQYLLGKEINYAKFVIDAIKTGELPS